MTTRIPLIAALALAACGTATAPPEPVTEPTAGEPRNVTKFEASLLDSMNTQADPCDDFYEYACGGWVDQTVLPSDQARWVRSFSTISEDNQAIIQELASEAASSDDPMQQQLGNVYTACMDEETVNARGAAPLQPMLDQIAALETPESIMALSAEMFRVNGDVLFGAGPSPDFKRPKWNILYVGQSGLGLPDRSYYLKDDEESATLRADYVAHVASMLQLLGDAEADAQASAEAILAFETQLAEISMDRTLMRNPEVVYHPMDKAGLQALTPHLPWDTYLEGIGRPELNEFNVTTPDFFTGLDGLLSDVDPELIRDYFRWHLISFAAPHLSTDFGDANFAFYGTRLRGQKEQRPRWKRCVGYLDSSLGDLLGQAYVEREFAGESKATALEMIQNIESAFASNLEDLAWMEDSTRERAVEKMDAIRNKIGYPDSWRTYEGLETSADDHFGNVLSTERVNAAYYLDKSEKDVDPSEWHMSAPTVNAYYNPLGNEIVFPAGIMQEPFFSKDFPKAMNYGAMGMVMGHEVTHGFDDSGRKFSPTGEMTEWWAEADAVRFEEQAECVRAQYDSYEVLPGVMVNGSLTLGENIADLGGLKQSFSAYKAWLDANGEAGVGSLSPEQTFFVAYAQSWCSVATDEYLKVQVTTDTHSPARFRVNGPLVNLPDFAETFECNAGSPMVAENACEVW